MECSLAAWIKSQDGSIVEVVLCAEMAMAETSNDGVLTETKVSEIIHCSVCCGLLHDAKLLPCGHSYCLKCLEWIALKQDIGNADHLMCPECQRNCAIPSGGLQALPQNVYIDALVQLKVLPTDDRPGSGDERCLTAADRQVEEAALVSEMDPKSISLVRYSAETSAEGCGPYSVGKLDTGDPAAVDLPRKTGHGKVKTSRMRRCDQHAEREMAVYCRDCDEPMCEACFIRLHNGHRHSEVDDVVNELRDVLRTDAEKIGFISATDAANLRALEQQRSAVRANVQVRSASSVRHTRVDTDSPT